MFDVSINLVAVLTAAVANIVIGFVWYSPKLFGKSWIALVGKSEEELKKGQLRAMITGIISAFVMSYVLAHFIDYTGSITVFEGVQAGFWIWLGFAATVTAGNDFFACRPVKLYLINNGCSLVTLVVMGIILTVWI